MKLGKLYKTAEQFEKLQKELPVLIELSNINKTELRNKVKISESCFYKNLKEKSFNADQLIRLFRAMVEIQNYNLKKQP